MRSIRELTIKLVASAVKIVLFRTLSFSLAGTALAIFEMFNHSTLDSQGSLFNFLVDPWIYLVLAISTFVSIYLLYEKNWKCKCHKGILKYVHIYGVFFTGLVISFFSYFITILTWFLTYVNIHSGGQLNNSIGFVRMVNEHLSFLPIKDTVWIVPLLSYPLIFITQDIFFSYDGHSGIIFRDNGPLITGLKLLIREFGKKFSSRS